MEKGLMDKGLMDKGLMDKGLMDKGKLIIENEQPKVEDSASHYQLSTLNSPLVKEGYKQTEVGVIPEDWDIVSFGSIVNYIKGYAFKSAEYTSSGVRIIRVSDTTFDSITDDNAVFIAENNATIYKKWQLKENDLIFSTVGSKPPMYDSLVGKVILIKEKYNGSLLNQNAVIIRVSNRSLYLQQLLLNHFRTERYISFIELIYRGNANQASITLKELFGYLVPLPRDHLEQKAIAKALSDVDALIEAQEKLIAKKQAIETATMQQLLTGKKRLPGFGEGKGTKQTELGEIPEDWEVKPLGELLRIRHGKNQSDVISIDGKYPILGTGGEMGRAKEFLYSKPSVLIGRKGTIDVPRYMETPFWTVDTLFYSEVFDSADAKFLFYKFGFIDWYLYNEASGVPSLNAATIEKIIQIVPFKVGEQTAIAEFITDFDKEIEALESKLKKTKSIKQGMMQELLTGKTRLIENG